MFKLQRLEITGFKSFADYTEIVFTGNGITAVVGPNGCGKSNVSDAISWVLGEQRAKQLRGAEMKDVVFQGTRDRKPSGMAEVVLHLVRDEELYDAEDQELEDIDETLSELDEHAVDLNEVGGEEEVAENLALVTDRQIEANGFHESPVETEVVQAADRQHHTVQGRGNGKLRCVRKMCLSARKVAVQLRRKCAFDLARCAGEGDAVSAVGYAVDGESLRFEPCLDTGEVGVIHAEETAVLLRREPLVVIRGTRRLLRFN